MTNRTHQQQTEHKRRLAERDAALRALRTLDPDRWSIPALARAFDVSVGTAHRVIHNEEER